MKVDANSAEAKYFRDIEAGLAAEGVTAHVQGGYRAEKAEETERALILRATWNHPVTDERMHTRTLRMKNPGSLTDEQKYGRLVRAGVRLVKSEITPLTAEAGTAE